MSINAASTTFLTTTISSHPPLPTSNSNGGGDSNPSLAASAALYLYTFLATLLLLLAISCTVIVRAIVVRRRRRRFIQDAIRNGAWPPTDAAGRAARLGLVPPGGFADKFDLNNPPKLWEVYLTPECLHHTMESTKAGKSISSAWRGEGRTYLWGLILPFSATFKHVEDKTTTPSNDSRRRRRDEMMTPLINPFSILTRLANSFNTGANSNTNATQQGASGPDAVTSSPTNTRLIGNGDASTPPQTSAPTLSVGPSTSSTPPTTTTTTPNPRTSKARQTRHKQSATQKGDANAVHDASPISVVVMIAMPRPSKAKQGAGIAEVRIDMSYDSSTHMNTINKEYHKAGGDSDQPIDLPHVELGIAEVVVRPAEAEVDKSESQVGETAEIRKTMREVEGGA